MVASFQRRLHGPSADGRERKGRATRSRLSYSGPNFESHERHAIPRVSRGALIDQLGLSAPDLSLSPRVDSVRDRSGRLQALRLLIWCSLTTFDKGEVSADVIYFVLRFFVTVSRSGMLISTDSKCDCSRSLSTNPVARSTSRGTERNVGRRLACFALVALGVLVAPEPAFAQRTPAKDLENLAGNPLTSGIWSNGEIMWVAHSNASNIQGTRTPLIYAYDIESGARVTCNDDPLDYCEDFVDLHPDNTNISAIWSDRDTMWVTDWASARIYAYSMEAKAAIGDTPEERNEWAISEGFNLLRGTSSTPEQTIQANVGAWGLWSDGNTMWVTDIYLYRIFAYDMETKDHVRSKDFKCGDLLGGALTPRGIWADRRTIWVVDGSGVFAFDRSNHNFDRAKSFDAGRLTGDHPPRDIWSDGETMWLAYEGTSKKIYAFDLTGLDESQAPPAPSSGRCSTIDEDGNGNGVDLPVLSISNPTASEADGNIVFTVTLSQESAGTVSVSYATSGAPDGGTAMEGTDYVRARGTLRIPANTRTGTISVSLRDDSLDEDDETFTLTLTSATNASLSSNMATGTISDNDAKPTVSIQSEATGVEGREPIRFAVTLSEMSGREVTVTYTIAGVTATEGEDYTRPSPCCTLTFMPGDTEDFISLELPDDSQEEGEETFVVRLTNATNADLVTTTATATIYDDDGPPSLSIHDASANEADRTIRFTVRLVPSINQEVTVTYNTENGTGSEGATAPEDFVAATDRTLTFGRNTEELTIPVTVNNDTLDEEDEETFTVELSNATVATIVRASATGTIEDNDMPPVLSIKDEQAGEASGAIKFKVGLSNESGKQVTVEYETSAITATEGVDYIGTSVPQTLIFDPGEMMQEIPVTVIDDQLREADETFSVKLTTPSNATFRGSETEISAIGTIGNDDALPVLSFVSDNVEADEGTGSVDFTVKLASEDEQTLGSGQVVRVSYRTRGGTATEGEDYTKTEGILEFEPGESEMPVKVPLKDDNVFEGPKPEEFTLDLRDASNAQEQSTIATGKIRDNDSDSTEIDLTVNPETISEGDDPQSVVVTATLDGSVRTDDTDVAVTVSGIDDTEDRVDFSASPESFTIRIPPGSKSAESRFTLTPFDDQDVEMHQTVTVSGSADISVEPAEIELTDNDAETPTGITLSVQPRSISEGAGEETVTVTAWLDGRPRTENTTVVTVDVPPSVMSDPVAYSTSTESLTVTILANSASAEGTFMLTPLDDEVDSGDSTVTVTGTVTDQPAGYVSGATLKVGGQRPSVKPDHTFSFGRSG